MYQKCVTMKCVIMKGGRYELCNILVVIKLKNILTNIITNFEGCIDVWRGIIYSVYAILACSVFTG